MAQNFLSDIKLGDNIYIRLGDATNGDLQVLHDGTNSTISNQTGDLQIINHSDDKDIVFYSDDGSGSITEYFRVDGDATNVLFSRKAKFSDNVEVVFGDGADLKIFHDGTNSIINDNGTGNLQFQIAGTPIFDVTSDGITMAGWPESDYELKGDIDGGVRFDAQAGEALSKGDVVYISGAVGDNTVVSKAQANSASTMPAFGLVLKDAANGAACQIVTFGNLYGSGSAALDTSTCSVGDEIFVSAATAGEWTKTAPTGESNLVQKIGKILRVATSNGVIKVSGAGRSNATPNLNTGRLFVGNASNQAVADGTMYVDIANSRVGIGESNPDYPLHISSTLGFPVLIERTNASDAGIRFKDSTTTNADQVRLGAKGNNLQILTGGSESMRVTSDGDVGIGTDSPSYKLHIEDASDDFIRLTRTSVRTWGHRVDSSGRYNLRNITGTYNAFVVDSSNRVGLGVNPLTELHVKASSGFAEVRMSGASGSGSSLEFYENTTALADIYANTSKDLIFRNNGTTERMRILSGGNVAIGRTTADEKLHVGGTGKFDGDLHFGGAVLGQVYRPVESGSATDRFFLMFDYTNNASYPFLTNRTPNGAVVVKTGTAAGGGENEHFRIKGGDGTVDAYFTNVNLGIGTNSPLGKLEISSSNVIGSVNGGADELVIQNNGYSGISILSNNANAGQILFGDNDANVRGQLQYWHSDDSMRFGTSASERMRITSSGNVGIGVVPESTWYTGGQTRALQIGGTVSIFNLFDTRSVFANNYYLTTDGSDTYINTDEATQYYQEGGQHIWKHAPSGTADTTITWSESMRIASDGKVGIGTTSPSTKLYVDNGESTFNRGNSAGTIATFRGQNAAKAAIGTATSYFLSDVGIGTDSPSSTLDISAGTNLNAGFKQLSLDNFSNEGIGITFSRTSSDADLMALGVVDSDELGFFSRIGLIFATGGTVAYGQTEERMRITSGGLVGIGLTPQTAKLEVKENLYVRHQNAEELTFRIDNYGTTGTDAGSSLRMLNQSGDTVVKIDSRSGSTRDTYFNQGGDFGIGTDSPSAKLHIKTSNVNNTNQFLLESTDAGASSAPDLALYRNSASPADGDVLGALWFYGNNDASAQELYSGIISVANDVSDTTEDGEIRFLNMVNGTLDTRMTIDGTSVGIGTTSPARTLDVRGDAQILSTGATGLRIVGGAANEVYMIFGDADDNSMGGFGYDNNTNELSIDVNNQERIRIDSSGNVGIGTDDPSQKLEVAGNVKLTGSIMDIRFIESDTTNVNSLIRHQTGLLRFDTISDDEATITTRVALDHSTGNVGIGTTSPDSLLHIESTADTSTPIFTIENDNAIKMTLGVVRSAAGTSPDTSFVAYDGSLRFIPGSGSATEKLTLDSAGNATFAGDVTVTGDLVVNGTETILNTETVEVEDNIIVLNKTNTSMTATTSGISVYRGASAAASFIFDDSDDYWDLTHNLAVAGNGTFGGTVTTGGALTIPTGSYDEIVFTGTGGTKILAPVEMYLQAANDIYLMSHSSVNLTLGNNTATFAGNLTVQGATTRLENNVTVGNSSSDYLETRYNDTANYATRLMWKGLQLGNNGVNKIIAGRTGANGYFDFYVNNTNDGLSGTPDGDLALTIAANKNATFSGQLIIESAYPTILLTDTNNNDDWGIYNNNGKFLVYNQTDAVSSFQIDQSNNATFAGTVTATSFTGDGANISNVYKKIYDESWGATPEAKYIEITLPFISGSGASKYYYFDVLGYRDIGSMDSQLHYRVYLHNRANGVDNNDLSADVFAINEAASESFGFGFLEGGASSSKFLIKALEDYSRVAIVAYPSDAVLTSSMISSTETAPTGYTDVTFATTRIKGDVEVGGDATFAGNVTVSGTYPKIILTDTDNNPDFTIIGGNGQFGIYDETNSTYRLQINSSGNATFGGGITISKSVGDSVLTIEADTDNNNENDNPRIELKQDSGIIYGHFGINGDANATFTGAGANSTYIRAAAGLDIATDGSTKALTIDNSQNATFAGNITTSGSKISVTQADGDDLAKLYQTSADGFLELFTGEATPVSRVKLSSYGDSYIAAASTGRVGIGTTSPSKRLHVYQTGNNQPLLVQTDDHVGIQVKGGNSHDRYISFQQANGSVGSKVGWDHSSQTLKLNAVDSFASTHLAVDVNGNVGIGTASPDAKLMVNTADQLIARFKSSNTGTTGIRIQGVDTSASDAVFVDWVYDAENRKYGFGEGTASGELPINSGLSHCDIVFDDAKVGIGTDSPQAALHVAGAFNSTSPTGNGVLMGYYLNAYGYIQLNGTSGGYIDFSTSGTDHKGRILYDNTNNYLRLDTDGAERVRITSGGSLQMAGTGTDNDSYAITFKNGACAIARDNNDLELHAYDNMVFGVSNTSYPTSTERMRITSGGLVGIGTNAPARDLHLKKSNSGGQVRAEVFNTSNTANSHGIVSIYSGGASAGDPFLHWKVEGIQDWSMGIDNSDSDKLKISKNFGPGTNDYLSIDTSGNATFEGAVIAKEAVQVPYAAATKKPMIVLQNATNYGLFHTEASNDIFSFDFNGVSKHEFNQNGNATFTGTAQAAYIYANNPSGAANGSAQEIARFVNTSSGATSSYMYIGASSGTDWRLGKNINGTSSNANFGITKHSGTAIALEIDTLLRTRLRSTDDYVLGLVDSGGTDQWWLKAYNSNGNFAIHENGVGDQFTIAAGGTATFAGNVIVTGEAQLVSNLTTDNTVIYENDNGTRWQFGSKALTATNKFGGRYHSGSGWSGLLWSINSSGNVAIAGSLSKGSGSFKIDHPLESKKDTHDLVHSFIEGPQADLIYRGKVDLVDGQAEVNIDTEAGMTEGTFVLLNTNVQCFTTNESNWDLVKGSVSGNILTIESQNTSSTATISWMVVGERQDQHMIDTDWTDDNGKIIVEPRKVE